MDYLAPVTFISSPIWDSAAALAYFPAYSTGRWALGRLYRTEIFPVHVLRFLPRIVKYDPPVGGEVGRKTNMWAEGCHIGAT